MTDTKEIEWCLARKAYRAIVDRGRFYYVVGIDREVYKNGKDGEFKINFIKCDKDGAADRDDPVFRVSHSKFGAKTFALRKDALTFAIGLADAELAALLRKVA